MIIGGELDQVENVWDEAVTTTHQDHVIAHVIGTTALAYIILDDAIHLLLDIGFIWNIYLDGEMGLLPHPVATSELEVSEDLRSEIKGEIDLLLRDGAGAASSLIRFSAFTIAPLIVAVHLFRRNDELKLVIECDTGNIEIRTSMTDHKFHVIEATVAK
jgi:hypothetical protein